MKILIIGGYGPSLINFRGPLLKAFIKEGHEVFTAAPADDAGTAATLEKSGVSYTPVHINRTGMNPADDLRTLIDIWKTVRRIKPDKILCYTIKPVIYGSIAAALAGHREIYSMITGLGYAFGQTSGLRGLLFRLVKSLYKLSLGLNKAVMFQNPDDKKLFTDLGIISGNKKAVVTNGSGIDLKHFELTAQPAGETVFLCLSRLLKEKGVCEYAQAAIKLKREFPEVRFRLVGPHDKGPDSIPEEKINSWKTSGLECPGEVQDVRPEIASACVYVLPSYREGTPRSVLEAMSMGRAVITTDVPGCRETVVEGLNGFLVPARDIDSLAEAMKKFIANKNLVEIMGRQSRALAEKKYDVTKVNKTIMDAMNL
jgi:glycosyltransferase involved in cell wall biosynthesis